MKARIIAICFVVIALVGLYWLFNTSSIYVRVENGNATSDVSYEITSQGSNKTTSNQTRSHELRVRVRKGSYQLLVKQGDSSYFEVIETKPFLKSTPVTAKLMPEKSRTFVGNQPDPCVYYSGSLLASYTCTGLYSQAKIHVPANASTPTYTIKAPSTTKVYGYIEGVAKLDNKSYALIHTPLTGDDTPKHVLYSVGSDFSLGGGTELRQLDGGKNYSLAAYGDGFIAYDESYQQVLYYSSLTKEPEVISLEKPKRTNLNAVSFKPNGKTVTLAFSSGTNAKSGKAYSEIIVASNGNQQHFAVKSAVSDAVVCGQEKLCVLGDKNMAVYTMSGSELALDFKVNGVRQIVATDSELLAVTPMGILNVDPRSGVGFLEYSFGGYGFVGIQKAQSGYIATVNKGDKSVALYIDPAKENSDGIDKKVLDLQKLPEISNVSAYGKYLYISPNLGEATYISSLSGYGFTPAARAAAALKIKSAVEEARIDQSAYTVINTQP